MVIFNTGTKTFHGHSKPLECPASIRRNSLAVYYYIMDRPRDEYYTRRNDEVEWLAIRKDEVEDLQKRGLIK
jgi:hypothetical protein